MKEEIYNLNEKMTELYLQYEKIEVLVRDLYNGYFGIVNEEVPGTLSIINSYFKPNAVKCGMIVDLLPYTNELFEEIRDKLEELSS